MDDLPTPHICCYGRADGSHSEHCAAWRLAAPDELHYRGEWRPRAAVLAERAPRAAAFHQLMDTREPFSAALGVWVNS